jgi:hypothetical protein
LATPHRQTVVLFGYTKIIERRADLSDAMKTGIMAMIRASNRES